MNERIKDIRKKLGLSQVEFGTKIGISGPAIAKIERGANNPSDQTTQLICSVFDVNPEWLKDGDGPIFLENTEMDMLIEESMPNSSERARQIIKDFYKTYGDTGWDLIESIMKLQKNAGR